MQNTDIINALSNLIQNQINKNNLDLNIAFNNFIQNAKCRCRIETIKYYQKKYKLLSETLNFIGIYNLSDINKNTYNKMILILKNNGYKNNTINKVCDLLKSIFKVNVDLDFIQNNPLAGIKKLKEEIPQIKIINNLVQNKIFDYLFHLNENFLNVRNTLIVLLLNDTSARINELVNIKLKNVNIEEQSIYLEFTKTGKPRKVYFQTISQIYLKKYFHFLDFKCEYLFITKENKQLKRDSIYLLFEHLKKTLHIKQSITPHKWRHSFATKLINNNVNLNTIMQVLGHTEYSTTARYLHQDQDKMKNDILEAIKKG